MKHRLPHSLIKSLAVSFLLLSTLILWACLPGEDDVANRYNGINQRVQIENTGISLMQAASNMSAFLVADSMRRKAPLDKIGLTGLRTAEDNVKPTDPKGIRVVECKNGMLGALAFFTEQPKGVPPLNMSGQAMRHALTQRFGGKSVGWASGGKVVLPEMVTEAGCTDTSGIIDNSPIFASGVLYKGDEVLGMVMSDSSKVTWPSVKHELTIACPSGYSGVIKREQTCKLITDENGKEKLEDVKIKTGVIDNEHVQSPGYEVNVVRTKKTWECDPAEGATLTPTSDEITEYCWDNSVNMNKPNDNPITLSVENLKQDLETGTTGNMYSVICRRNADGTNTCSSQNYTPPAGWTVKCDQEVQDPRYVINPTFQDKQGRQQPITDWNTGLIKPSGTEVDCGRGWVGDIKWEYQLRQCRLYSPEGKIQPTQPKTIYWMGQVAMKCKRDPKPGENWEVQCPVGVGSLFVKKRFTMNRFLALNPLSYEKGKASAGSIFIGEAGPETEARLRKPEFAETIRLCDGPTSPTWEKCVLTTFRALLSTSEKAFTDGIANAIGSPDVSSIPVACNTERQTCKTLGEVEHLILLVDKSGSMTRPDATVSYKYPRCDTAILDYFDAGANRAEACGIVDNFKPEYQVYHQQDCSALPVEERQTCEYDNNDSFGQNFIDETNMLAQSQGARLAALSKPGTPFMDWAGILKSGFKCDRFWQSGYCRRGLPAGSQNTCVGTCSEQQNEDFGNTVSRFDAIKRYLTNVIVPSLKGGVKLTYGEIGSNTLFTRTVCEKDSVFTYTFENPITKEKVTISFPIRCNPDDDRNYILQQIGNSNPNPSTQTPFYNSVRTITDRAIADGATGQGTYMLVLTDGQPTDDAKGNGMTGVCTGDTPFFKYVQEKIPGTFVNLILLGKTDLGDVINECNQRASDIDWEFTNNQNVSDLSTVMDRKFPSTMPAPGAQMCAEYFKAHSLNGYLYNE